MKDETSKLNHVLISLPMPSVFMERNAVIVEGALFALPGFIRVTC